MSNNNKQKVKLPNTQDLKFFFEKYLVTPKEENEMWSKFGIHSRFGMERGSQLFSSSGGLNRRIIQSENNTYYYLAMQIDDKESPIVYKKMIVNSFSEAVEIWNLPENQWKFDLVWFEDKWTARSKLPKPPKMTAEEDAINIIESIVMAKIKAGKSLSQEDFYYSYIGNDKEWHRFLPRKQKMIDYAFKFDKIDFIDFLISESFKINYDHYLS